MIRKLINIIIIYVFISCSDKVPTYYSYTEFEILRIGSHLSEILISPNQELMVAADQGNNRLIFIDITQDKMKIKNSIFIGSSPHSLDFTPSGDTLFVGLLGSSKIIIYDINLMQKVNELPTELDSPYDIAFIPPNRMVVSFMSSNPSYNKTKLYEWTTMDDSTLFNLVLPYSSINYAGPLTLTPDKDAVFILDKFNGPPIRLYKYDITETGFQNKINTTHIADNVTLNDIEYVNGYGVAVALEGDDDGAQLPLNNSFLYNPENMNLEFILDAGSTVLALESTYNGESIFLSPSKIDDAGKFVIQFNTQSHLQSNYYLTAGSLAKNCLVIDNVGQFIYVAVDDYFDNDSNEPYNSDSFDIQKIRIVDEFTYPINDHF